MKWPKMSAYWVVNNNEWKFNLGHWWLSKIYDSIFSFIWIDWSCFQQLNWLFSLFWNTPHCPCAHSQLGLKWRLCLGSNQQLHTVIISWCLCGLLSLEKEKRIIKEQDLNYKVLGDHRSSVIPSLLASWLPPFWLVLGPHQTPFCRHLHHQQWW